MYSCIDVYKGCSKGASSGELFLSIPANSLLLLVQMQKELQEHSESQKQ